MKTIAGVTLALAAAVMMLEPASGQSVLVKVPKAASFDIERYLPPLPTDIPWLTTREHTQPRSAASPLPEAGSLDALLWLPKAADTWAPPLNSQSATASTLFGG